jgi:transposase
MMRARILQLARHTLNKLLAWKKEAESDGAYRVARRVHALLLNHDGYSSGQISRLLKAPRSRVSEWLRLYEAHGAEALLEGQRSGRPAALTDAQRQQLADILDSGPRAYGFLSAVWSSPMIARVIEEEFGVAYHPGHVRKLLDRWGYSVQRPRRHLAQADLRQQNRWRRYTYPNLKKKPVPKGR